MNEYSPKSGSRQLRSHQKLRDRCDVLVEVVSALGRLYRQSADVVTKQHYIETIVGAALWYLPTSKELWTGRISVGALKDFHPTSGLSKPRLTEDHEFPRKVSAIELMERDWGEPDPGAVMLELYLSKYGRFNFITPTENKILVKYQKTHVFDRPSVAYAQAGVELLEITASELQQVRSRSVEIIERCLKRTQG